MAVQSFPFSSIIALHLFIQFYIYSLSELFSILSLMHFSVHWHILLYFHPLYEHFPIVFLLYSTLSNPTLFTSLIWTLFYFLFSSSFFFLISLWPYTHISYFIHILYPICFFLILHSCISSRAGNSLWSWTRPLPRCAPRWSGRTAAASTWCCRSTTLGITDTPTTVTPMSQVSSFTPHPDSRSVS